MSTVRASNYANAAGSKSVGADYVVEGTAKAWANLNGTGTIALSDSFNISSVTDGGTGVYTKNLTNAMTDANFAVGSAIRAASAAIMATSAGSASSIEMFCDQDFSGTKIDPADVQTSAFGDLA